MSNKQDREIKELKSCVQDPRTVREFWRSVGQKIAMRPAVRLPVSLTKDGEETLQSLIEGYSYATLADDLRKANDPSCTEPTELELMLQCQMVKARFDTSAATFIRDTIGAKPVDESKVEASVNPYESLSDEELQLLAEHRAALKNSTTALPVAVPFDTLLDMHERGLKEVPKNVDTTNTTTNTIASDNT